MPADKRRTRTALEVAARWIARNPRKTMIAVTACVAAISINMPPRVDTSATGLLRADSPERLAYDRFQDTYGRDEIMIVGLPAGDAPGGVFNIDFLTRLRALHGDIERSVPHIKEITSLVNVRRTTTDGSDLVVEEFMVNWPKTAADAERLRQEALTNPVYVDHVVSSDARFAAIVIETYASPLAGADDSDDDVHSLAEVYAAFDDATDMVASAADTARISDEDSAVIIAAIENVLARHRTAEQPIVFAGSPVVTKDLTAMMMENMPRFMLGAIFVIALALGLLFRRPSAVVVSLTVVVTSVVSTIGMMAWLDVPIQIPTQVLPSFLLAVGVCDAVHIMAIFFHEYDGGKSKQDAIAYAVGHSGPAVVMTSVTTAAGLLSFAGADIAPIAALGWFAALGVGFALMLSLVLPCAMLSLIPIKAKPPARAGVGTRITSLIEALVRFNIAHPKKIVAVAVAVVTVAAIGATRIEFGHDHLEWLPYDHDLRVATRAVDRHLKGSTTVEVLISTEQDDGLFEPALLEGIEAIRAELGQLEGSGGMKVGITVAMTDIIKEVNKVLHDGDPAAYAVPKTRRAVAQEIAMYQMFDDEFERVADLPFSEARLTIKLPWADATVYHDFVEHIERVVDKHIDGHRIAITGMAPMMSAIVAGEIDSTVSSYAIALVVVTILMILFVGRLRLGLLSMIPNVTPVLITFGIMGYAGLPMDMFTMLIGSIALGIVVDDTIHFMHTFRRYYEDSGSTEDAVRRTLHTTGRALFVTSMVLGFGFSVFAFSSMANIAVFGLLTASTIGFALVADLVFAPALLILACPERMAIKGTHPSLAPATRPAFSGT